VPLNRLALFGAREFPIIHGTMSDDMIKALAAKGGVISDQL